MNENKYIGKGMLALFLSLVALMLLVVAFRAEGEEMETSDKVIKLIETAKPTIQSSFGLPDCRITQGEAEHHSKESGHILGIDIACDESWAFGVHAPYTFEDYEYVYRGTDKRLGDYHVIKNGDTRYIFGHTGIAPTSIGIPQIGDKIEPGQYIGLVNLSGVSTNYHVHIEKWVGKENVSMVDGKVNEYSQKLCDQRNWAFCATGDTSKFYFTHYDLGDYKQNDSAPCHGASGADLCYLARNGVQTMALTSDIRAKLGVKFGDKVVLEGDEGCKGIYEVHDEMNKRFRTSCIKRPGTNYCIKGDLPGKVGGACTVKKIKY